MPEKWIRPRLLSEHPSIYSVYHCVSCTGSPGRAGARLSCPGVETGKVHRNNKDGQTSVHTRTAELPTVHGKALGDGKSWTHNFGCKAMVDELAACRGLKMNEWANWKAGLTMKKSGSARLELWDTAANERRLTQTGCMGTRWGMSSITPPSCSSDEAALGADGCNKWPTSRLENLWDCVQMYIFFSLSQIECVS